MGLTRILRHPIVTAFAALVWFSLPLQAQDRSAELLESLQSATPEEAERIDNRLRAEWSKSGSAAVMY